MSGTDRSKGSLAGFFHDAHCAGSKFHYAHVWRSAFGVELIGT